MPFICSRIICYAALVSPLIRACHSAFAPTRWLLPWSRGKRGSLRNATGVEPPFSDNRQIARRPLETKIVRRPSARSEEHVVYCRAEDCGLEGIGGPQCLRYLDRIAVAGLVLELRNAAGGRARYPESGRCLIERILAISCPRPLSLPQRLRRRYPRGAKLQPVAQANKAWSASLRPFYRICLKLFSSFPAEQI